MERLGVRVETVASVEMTVDAVLKRRLVKAVVIKKLFSFHYT